MNDEQRMVYGPYETEAEARADREWARQAPPTAGGHVQPNRDRLTRALDDADVQLGAYDDQVLAWLATWEDSTVQVIAGIISRAYDAGTRAELWNTDQVLAWLADQGKPVARDTWGAYVRRGQAPAPLRRVGRTPVWSANDVQGWHTGRRGQSWRADAIRPVDPTANLTPAQRDLYDRVIVRAGLDGSDCADVLAAMDANDIDRQAVTNALTPRR